FLASSGPGETATVLTLMRVARDAGAKVLLLTAEPAGSAARLADFTLLVPAQTMASDQGAARTSVLPMGSLFEGALFLLFEVMVLKLKALTGATPEAMRARHTNME
ncbi:SIS domain-containing protein, partial [Mesorhizobium sp. M2D.F.Ca.ET.223.01.1.1]